MSRDIGNKILYQRLLSDLTLAGIDVNEMSLVLRPYHHRYWGQYDFARYKAIVYIYSDKNRTHLRRYDRLLDTAIHEGTHHMMNLEAVVMKGNEHSQRFYDLYNLYKGRVDHESRNEKILK